MNPHYPYPDGQQNGSGYPTNSHFRSRSADYPSARPSSHQHLAPERMAPYPIYDGHKKSYSEPPKPEKSRQGSYMSLIPEKTSLNPMDADFALQTLALAAIQNSQGMQSRDRSGESESDDSIDYNTRFMGSAAEEKASKVVPVYDPETKRPMYHCPEDGCARAFTRRYNLISHMRVHSGMFNLPFIELKL